MRLLAASLLLLCAPALVAQEQESSAVAEAPPRGMLVPSQPPRDPDFGVQADAALGLERQVEMYQWHDLREGEGAPRYETAWSGEAIDSRRFAEPEGHENPRRFPFGSRRWMADPVLLDGHPVDPALLAHFDDWEPLAPDPARLPPNLAASFQPDGVGLTSGADPSAPQVGDMRVRWRALPSGRIEGSVRLVEGRWIADGDGPPRRAEPGESRGVPTLAIENSEDPLLTYLLIGIVVFFLVALLVGLGYRRRQRKASP